MYNAELAPKEIRGRLIGFQQLMIGQYKLTHSNTTFQALLTRLCI